MPYFRLETNVPQSEIPADATKKLCQVIAKTMDKPFEYCAATVIGGIDMAFAGTTGPTAQATLLSIGGLSVEANKKYSKVFGDFVAKELGIPADRMYIRYIDASSGDIGHNGTTFHEIFGK